MDLAFVLVTLRRARWVLLLAALVGIGGAAAVNATSPVEYTASVQQFVRMANQPDSQSGASGALSGGQFALQRVKSYTQVATGSHVLQPAGRPHMPIPSVPVPGGIAPPPPSATYSGLSFVDRPGDVALGNGKPRAWIDGLGR